MAKTRYPRIFTETLPHAVKRSIKGFEKALYFGTGGTKRLKKNVGRYLFLYILLLCAFCAYLVSESYNGYKLVQQVRGEEERRLVYWENIVKAHPNYTDAYYQAAVVAARLKDTNKAREYLNRALQLDPNFVEAQKLQKEL